MNLVEIINELRKEREAVDVVVAQLERLAAAQVVGPRRGRPPLSVSGLIRTRKPFSDATRKKMAEAQKRRWAAYRKAKAAEA